jgi:glycosyltransferase involved in cell wall biosynthesis
MRIAVLNRVFSRAGGGAESYAVALVEQLAQRHEVHVFSQESNQPVTGVRYHSVLCLGRKPRWFNQLVFAFDSWRQTRSGFDVVHSHENTWHGQVQTIHVRPLRLNLFARRSGWRRLLRWVKVAFSPRLLTYVWLEGARFRARSVVASSESLRDECEQAYPACCGAVAVITPGTRMAPASLSRAQSREQLSLPAQGRLLLFVANDYARKGLDALLQAMTQLDADIELLIVGNPRTVPKYRQLAERLGLAARVHYLGVVNGLASAYGAADCLVHPTLEDSYAMVVLEAMAHGLPVVVSGPAHCGIARELTDGVQALLLPDPNDATALAERIASVLGDADLAARLREQGLAFAKQHSWEEAALQYEALYSQAASINP